MGLPGKQRTAAEGRRRASHFALAKPASNKCTHCGKTKAPHHACPHCGFYRGREVVNTIKRASKSSKKTA